jgi:glycosyltransferase involved in cell wall biosynthesis
MFVLISVFQKTLSIFFSEKLTDKSPSKLKNQSKNMTNLLSINNYYYRRGGAEVVFLEQNKILEKLGWTVIPFSMKHAQNESTEWQNYFVNEIEYGATYGWRNNFINALKIIYSWEAKNKLQSLIDTIKPDIAHLHNVYHHLSPSILPLLKKNGIPTVMTLHDLKLLCPAYSMLNSKGICEQCKGGHIYNVVINKCMKQSLPLSTLIFSESLVHRLSKIYNKNIDMFILPSKFYLNKFIEWGWAPNRLIHIPNFVDTHMLKPNYQPGKYFVFFGRLSKEKGLKTLIHAANEANVALKIIGSGPQEEELKILAASLGANVTFLGFQTGEALHKAISHARAVVLPSEWYENAPMSILESYALGKPVIGANIGGIPELIRENETGTLFESAKVESLSNSLIQIKDIKDSAVVEMGKTARQLVENEYDTKNYSKRLQNLYSRLGVSLKWPEPDLDPEKSHPSQLI